MGSIGFSSGPRALGGPVLAGCAIGQKRVEKEQRSKRAKGREKERKKERKKKEIERGRKKKKGKRKKKYYCPKNYHIVFV